MGIRTRQAAFTLIELMVVLALVAIFVLVGVPSYESLTTTNRMATEINDLLADLQYARSEAIMRGVDVTICTGNGLQCSTSQGWNSGWIVNTGSQPLILREHSAISSTDSFISVSSQAGGGQLNSITFDRNGFSANTGTISLHDSADTISRRQCLMISTVGQISHASGTACP